MRHLGKTYEKKGGSKVLKEIRIALSANELDFILSGLIDAHEFFSRRTGISGHNPIRDARPISDLYFSLTKGE